MKFLIMFSNVEIYSSIMQENISLKLPVSNIELTFEYMLHSHQSYCKGSIMQCALTYVRSQNNKHTNGDMVKQKIKIPVTVSQSYIGLIPTKAVFGVCEQQRRRPACASAQTDQRLCYSLTEKYHILTCFKQNFNVLASLCS